MPHRTAKLKLVPESEATGHTREIFNEIKQALGVPHVHIVFQAYAADPAFFELWWTSIRSALQRQAFFGLADRLRADAYTRVHSYFAVPDFCARTEQLQLSSGARDELTRTVDLFQYYSSPLLLLAGATLLAFDGEIGVERDSPAAHHPVFPDPPVLVDEDRATPRITRVYEEIKRATGLTVVNTAYSAFARFPDFLIEYWSVLKPLIESPMHTESQFGLRDTAMALARELPTRLDLRKERLDDAGLDDDRIATVVRETQLFVKVLSGMVLNVAVAKVGLEGGTAKGRAAQTPQATPESEAAPKAAESAPKAA